MRSIALAACVGLALSAATAAYARDWTDPAGRINFTAPNGWNVDPLNATNATRVLTFDGSHDCYVIGQPNANTASASPGRVIRSLSQPLPESAWITVANSISDFFPDNSAQLIAQSVDTSGFWPIQRATLRSPDGEVFAAVQSRPGVDLMAFCRALGGSSTAMFDGVFSSMNHPNDATWRQQAEQEAQAREAAAAAQAQPQEQPQQQPQEEQRRRRRD
ncbi:MAG: hypothetical protein K2P58_01270 [Hyphomonadaceae bacterium]|nr:hypothetical protein [Hyphomonadaceae bacterium]